MGQAYKKGTFTYWKKCYHNAKFSAKYRNIDWQFTPEQWRQWWLDNGVDKNQPRHYKGDSFVMARYGDQGPYHPDNVYITTNTGNLQDADHTYDRNPKRGPRDVGCRSIHTPYGEYKKIKTAAEQLAVDVTTIYNRMKTRPTEYYYL